MQGGGGLTEDSLFFSVGWGGLREVLHCTENRIFVFPEKELRGLNPNSYIHVSVSDLYIPRIGPHIWLHQNRQNDPGNIQISHRYMSEGIGRQNIITLFWK